MIILKIKWSKRYSDDYLYFDNEESMNQFLGNLNRVSKEKYKYEWEKTDVEEIK